MPNKPIQGGLRRIALEIGFCTVAIAMQNTKPVRVKESMLILIIFGVLTAVGIVLLIIGRIYQGWSYEEPLLWTGGIITLVFGVVLMVICVVVMGVQIPKDKDYQKTLYEKQVLEYRLEHIEDNLVGSEMLYSEITEFNNGLRECKYYSDSLWVGLFYNDKIATIDYIEIPLLGESG